MIVLNTTPPYNVNIPNPVLGYLKGFLQARGMEVRTVYWNVVLSELISKLQRGLDQYSESKDFLSIFPVIFLTRQWYGQSLRETPLDILYQSLYSREEIAEMAHKAQEITDTYIKENNLHKASIAGFSLKTYQWLMAFCMIHRFKTLNPDTKIVIGGITSADQAISFMRIFAEADYAIWGEGEYPLFHLTKTVEEGGDPKNVPNIVYRDGNDILTTHQCDETPPLDSYPFADHSDYIRAFERYMRGDVLSDYIAKVGRQTADKYPIIIPIWGSRACPWNKCKFCVLNEEYTYRTRSPEHIVGEIEFQSKKYGVDSFIFVDTDIAGNKKRFRSLLKLLTKSSAAHEKKYRFFAEVSPIFIDPETARFMELSSFVEIQIGFEGMTDTLLEKMEKRHRFSHNIQAIKLANQHNVKISGLNVIRGIPGETEGDILESCTNLKFLRFFLKNYPLTPSTLSLDKGSPFYGEVGEERKTWKSSPMWSEIEPLNLVPESERFEFFGFSRLDHTALWADFESLLNFYTKQERTYEWVEYEDGSFVEERGLRVYKYVFDRDETDVLIFCDTMKQFSEVRERFAHVPEERLHEMLYDLKDAGFIYYDKDTDHIISVIDAGRRKVLHHS